MSWIFVAVLSPILSALGSYADKYLLVHREHTGGIGSVLIFSSVFGALLLPATVLLGADVFSVTAFEATILIINGCITVGTLAAYLYAIEHADVVSVTPVLQTVPVFGFIMGYVLLGETLQMNEVIGSALVIFCAVILSIEIEEEARVRFRTKSFLLASLSAFLFAFSGAVFKFVAIERGYWTVQFWEYLGITILGFILFFAVRAYRETFVGVVKGGRFDVVALNFLTEAVMVSADLVLNFATLLAPIALVYTVSSFQPAFLLLFALIASVLMPGLMHKLAFTRKHLQLKAIIILVMIFGTALIHLG